MKGQLHAVDIPRQTRGGLSQLLGNPLTQPKLQFSAECDARQGCGELGLGGVTGLRFTLGGSAP